MRTNSTPTPKQARLHALAAAFGLALASTALACDPGFDDELVRAIMTDVEAAEPASDIQPLDPDPAYADDIDDPIDGCSLEARPAALVTVLDDYGQTLSGDELDAVMWRHWDSETGWTEPIEALCIDEDCTRWALGHATPGVYTVGAFACGDHSVERFEVGLTEDGCHVDTQNLRLTLDEIGPGCFLDESDDTLAPTPATCDAPPRNPSVVALTGVREGDMILPWTPTLITSRHASESAPTAMDCLDEDCTQFVDGWGLDGRFEVRADICGESVHETVTVEPTADGCEVETEWVGLFVDAPTCSTTTMNYDAQ